MGGYWWIFLIVFLLVGGIVFMIAYTMPIAEKLFRKQWTRSDDGKFTRGCSDTSFDYHLDMYNQGMAFREAHKDIIKDVKITSLGLKMVGEYYDFGFKKAIILLPGRTETCYYGAFYAETFMKAEYNVLLIDPRAHGLSEGDKITLGQDEGVDALNWAKFLHDEQNIDSVVLYGLCGGATAACVALSDVNCPNYISAFIADGMFYSFFRVYRRHIIDEKKPVYPVIWEIMAKIQKHNKVNPYKLAPYRYMKKISVPVLFLSGENDKFAIPKETRKLFDKCASKEKQIAFISCARHSHLRYDNKMDYEKSVIEFLTRL